MDFLDVAESVITQDERIDDEYEEPDELPVAQSMSELAKIAERYHISEDAQVASLMVLAKMREGAFSDTEDHEEQGEGLVKKILHWVIGKVERTVVRFVFSSIFRLVKWLVKEVIIGGIKLMVKWLIRPILSEAIGFLVLNPEIGIPLAIVGLSGLGYLIYKKFFAEPSPEELARAKDIAEQVQTTMGATADIPMPAGEAEGIHTLTTQQLLRQGVATRSESLEALIARGEGSYNSVNLGGAHGYRASTADLEHMTVAEVMQHQAAGDFNAAGRYQVIKETLAGAVRALGLKGTELFNADTQDRIFETYLITVKRRQIADYIQGRSDDLNAAVLATSEEWASVAAPPGVRTRNGFISDGTTSFYAGVANNKASITAFEMAQVLQQERVKFMGQHQNTNVVTGVATPISTVSPQQQNQASIVPQAGSSSASPIQDIIQGPQNTLIALR